MNLQRKRKKVKMVKIILGKIAEWFRSLIGGKGKYYILEAGFNSAKDRDKALDVIKQERIHMWFDLKEPRAKTKEEEKNGK